MMTDRHNSVPVDLNTFFSTHAVFTVKDLQEFLARRGSTNAHTRKALVSYHRSKGRIVPVRRGLYASIPPGYSPDSYIIDPFLIAAKFSEDAVLAYHTALEFHGKAYSTYNQFVFISENRFPVTGFRGFNFRQTHPPAALGKLGKTMFGVETHLRNGIETKVTTLERTMVDVLDRPEISGSWEEIWRSLEGIEYFDIEQVITYAETLGNATTVAKVGYFLSEHQESLMVDDETLARLKRSVPSQPHYMHRALRKNSRLIRDWNLLVPVEILERTWEEIA